MRKNLFLYVPKYTWLVDFTKSGKCPCHMHCPTNYVAFNIVQFGPHVNKSIGWSAQFLIIMEPVQILWHLVVMGCGGGVAKQFNLVWFTQTMKNPSIFLLFLLGCCGFKFY